LLISEKLPPETKQYWMDMFLRWSMFQQMQNENGRNFLCRQRMMLRILQIIQLPNIVEWSHSYSNGMYRLLLVVGINIFDSLVGIDKVCSLFFTLV